MPDEPTDTDDADVVSSTAEMIAQRPLIQLFGTHGKTKILSVLVDAYPRPLNVATICERADIHHDTWYAHRDDLMALGIVVDASDAGTSLYSVPDPDEDQRVAWLEQLTDWTAAYAREGRRPTVE